MISLALDLFEYFGPLVMTLHSTDLILLQDNSFGNRQGDTWEKVNQIRDKFEYDRERRMREKGQLNVV